MKICPKPLVIFIVVMVVALNGCAPDTVPPATPENVGITPTPPTATPTVTPTPLPFLSLQEDNELPQILLAAKPSPELADNHIGIHTEGFDRYRDATEEVLRNGFKRIRIQSLTEFWGNGNDYKTFYLESIPPEVDEVISNYVDNGVNIVLDLWMGAGLVPYGTKFQNEAEIDQYLDYVRFVVLHFKGRIRYYQIWNEPGDMTVSEYANLISRTVPVIREEDPEARIIMNALMGTWENGYPGYGKYQRFGFDYNGTLYWHIDELLRSGVVDMVDGISWHPIYDNIPGDSYYQDYPQIVQKVKDIATSQGFTGEYFADEILWRTVTEAGWDGGPPVSRPIAAKYYTRAIAENRGLGLNVTINTFFLSPFLAPIHNLNDILAGAEPTNITMLLETVTEANVRHYAFMLPNGDKLVALWTNDEAVEKDPGVNATLTFPNSSAQSVTGIDIFNGFEQELIAETENGDLVIRDLLVKDYPIIIRITR